MSKIDEYFSKKWLDYYQRSARNYFFYTGIEHEDIGQDAQLALHQKLGGIGNREITEAFVRTCYKNILTDLYRHHLGRHRPPTWVKRLGPIWLEIWEMYCLRGMPVEALSISIVGHAECISADWIANVVQRIRAEHACPKPRATKISIDSEKTPGSIVADYSDPESEINMEDVRAVVNAIVGGTADHARNNPDTLVINLFNDWNILADQINLSSGNKILLRLVFQENLSVSDAARELNLKIHTARRQLKDCCKQIREVLERNGIFLSDFVN